MPYVQVVSEESDKLIEDKEVDEARLGEFIEGLYERLTPEFRIVVIDEDSSRFDPPV